MIVERSAAMSRLQVLLASLCFGTTGTAQALGPAGIDPVGVGSARIAVGGALLALVALVARRAVGRSGAGGRGGMARSGAGVARRPRWAAAPVLAGAAWACGVACPAGAAVGFAAAAPPLVGCSCGCAAGAAVGTAGVPGLHATAPSRPPMASRKCRRVRCMTQLLAQ
jgi:hypothetical protein